MKPLANAYSLNARAKKHAYAINPLNLGFLDFYCDPVSGDTFVFCNLSLFSLKLP